MEKQTISVVNHMIEVLNERILGYRKAADNVKDSQAKSVFTEYSMQAENFADELVPFTEKYTKDDLGTRAHGDAFRFWMDIKSAVTAGGKNAMIEACKTGEDAAIRNYEEALDNKELDAEIRGILSKHLSEIKTAKARIDSMKE